MADSIMIPAQPEAVSNREIGNSPRERLAAHGPETDLLVTLLADWESIWASCRKRIRRWRVPPHWSFTEWIEELKAEGAVASLQARSDFNTSLNVPLAAYVRMRVLGAVISRYRKEWSYAIRAGSALLECHASAGWEERMVNHLDVRLSISGLPEPDRRLMERLYWGGETELEIARTLGVTQQSVSKRKRAILAKLRGALAQAAEPRPGGRPARASHPDSPKGR